MGLINEALTHSSYAAENPGSQDYEKLEFFGDAVLKFVISEYLLERFPDYDEGQLTELRAVLVSDRILAEIGEQVNLSKYILLGFIILIYCNNPLKSLLSEIIKLSSKL